jgi:hypothetical protein
VAVTPAPSLGGAVERTLQDLLNCMCISLAQAGWEGDCCLEALAPDWSACGQDSETDRPVGHAWGRLLDVYPTRQFPTRAGPADPSSGEVRWVVLAELGAFTYVCPEDCGCDVRAANATLVMKIAEAGLAGAACCQDGCSEVLISDLSTAASEDGCAGFTMQVVFPAELCCDATGDGCG